MYPCLFTKSNVRVPFDEFTVGVFHTLNVTPTQLHPNSWTSLQTFYLLAEMFRLSLSSHVFLHFYSSRPAKSARWLSQVSQAGFKNVFLKICILHIDKGYFLNGNTPKFPLYCTQDSIRYHSWPKLSITEDDKKMFDILDKCAQWLPIRKVLNIFLSSQHWVDLKDICVSFWPIMMETYFQKKKKNS